MDETTYSDERVLGRLAQSYVCVRVDRDQRPDVDRRYNQGGWPTTCLVNHQGSLLWGGTYVPPDHLADILARVAEAYARDPALAAALPPRPAAQAEAGAPAASLADGPARALGLTKKALQRGVELPMREALQYEAALQELAGHAGEYVEGVAAFKEKRRPDYRSRI
jgi:uncharacterized protein YyaL (SSP411 family)